MRHIAERMGQETMMQRHPSRSAQRMQWVSQMIDHGDADGLETLAPRSLRAAQPLGQQLGEVADRVRRVGGAAEMEDAARIIRGEDDGAGRADGGELALGDPSGHSWVAERRAPAELAADLALRKVRDRYSRPPEHVGDGLP